MLAMHARSNISQKSAKFIIYIPLFLPLSPSLLPKRSRVHAWVCVCVCRSVCVDCAILLIALLLLRVVDESGGKKGFDVVIE